MESLKQKKCVPCQGGEPTVTESEMEDLKPQIPEWEIITEGSINKLQRKFDFPNFKQALEFTNRVGEIAEEENHHPMLITEWGKVTVLWWTHKIAGLHENDFIMAAKTDEVHLADT